MEKPEAQPQGGPRKSRRNFSDLTREEKIARISKSIAKSRKRIEQQERLMGELKRRMDPNRLLEPKLGLRTWEEVKAYVDRIANGSDKAPD